MPLIFGANFSESVGPNKTIIGMFARLIICIIPLSIVIASSSLEERAVTNAGQDMFEWCSGKRALGSFDLIISFNAVSFFSIKKTGTLFFISDLFASEIIR